MGQLDIDRKIAEYYAPLVLRPISTGENAALFWFPGSGMGTIVKDVIGDRTILAKHLLGFQKTTKIVDFWGHLSDEKSLGGLLKNSGFASTEELQKNVREQLEKGREMALFINRIDSFTDGEKMKILRYFLKVSLINKRRIHVVFNSTDKPWFISQIEKFPELRGIANALSIIPVISGDLLKQYICERASQLQFKIDNGKISELAATYGGILSVLKEYIRSSGNWHVLELKLRLVWDEIPEIYKEIISNFVLGKPVGENSENVHDIKSFGVANLGIFKKHWISIDRNPEKTLTKYLTESESRFWRALKLLKGKVLDKEGAVLLLRPENKENVSLWAIDQAVSRFRKKLSVSGIDSGRLKTLKGRGYIWKE